MLKNYYKVMGVDILSTLFDIRQAYKRLALKFHPDKTKIPTTAETFKEVCEAYKILSNNQERQRYNKKFSSSKQSRERFLQDPPVYHEVPISLDDIFFGTMKIFTLTKKIYRLDGSCSEEQKEFKLIIKRGMKEGTKFTFSKEGDEKPQHIPADIVFVLKELPHPLFTRHGTDLHHSISISFDQLLAGKIDAYVPLLNGRRLHVNMRNCSLTRTQSYRVCGKGLPAIDGKCGDMIVTIHLDLPVHFRSICINRGKLLFRFHI